MSLQRVLKYFNITVAVLLVGAIAVAYWIGYRPLPKTSGVVSAPIADKATVRRDALGTPHISASSLDDAWFVQGYVTAQDRLWQMDALRRMAGGELAEIIGPAGLESDREARRMRLPRIAEQAAQSMPPQDRAAFAAYARGVNAFIESQRDRLPLEFTLLGYQPRPWRVSDCVLITLHMIRTLTNTWKSELLKAALLDGGDRAKVEFLFPVRSGGEIQPGSNAWVIEGRRTASGKPLLANDMHLEFSIPGIWYMAHILAPGINVAGVALPGVPGIIVGHNDRIAWGITNLPFDVEDLYIEQFDDQSGRYRFRGQTEQARPEREIILVKGSRPVEQTNWVTRHGPLWVAEGKRRLTLRWIAGDAGRYQYPFIDIDRARDWRQFTAALARLPGPGSNFVYADVDGNIGYHAAGQFPIRKDFSGDVPVDGSSGNYEWDAFIPFEELPAAFNPSGGVLVTANENPFPAAYPYPVSGNFAPPYRSLQIRHLLTARQGWRPGDMLAVQKDVYSAFSHFLAGQLVAAYDRHRAAHPGLAQAIGVLRAWNGQMEKDLAAPLVVSFAYQHFRKAVGEAASPGKGAGYEYPMAPAVIERLLRERPAGWFADYDLALLKSFEDAIQEGRRIQGRNVEKWKYGRSLETVITHPVGHNLPFVGKYFDIGPAPMSGSSTTVKQTTRRFGPSMRMVADPGGWDRSLLNLPIGESGQVLSRHYKDQWDRYYTGLSYPMQFARPEAGEVLEIVPAAP